VRAGVGARLLVATLGSWSSTTAILTCLNFSPRAIRVLSSKCSGRAVSHAAFGQTPHGFHLRSRYSGKAMAKEPLKDEAEVEVICPRCGYHLRRTAGRLRRDTPVVCPNCGERVVACPDSKLVRPQSAGKAAFVWSCSVTR